MESGLIYKLSITTPTEENKLTYTTYNNKLNAIKRKTERDYFSNQLEINKSDMKKSWKIMKSVIGNKRKLNQTNKRFIINNNIIENELRIANQFNNYFVSIGPTLAAIQLTTNLDPLHFLQNNTNSMAIRHIEYIEVINIINSINNSSPGWDRIPSILAIKKSSTYTLNHLHLS